MRPTTKGLITRDSGININIYSAFDTPGNLLISIWNFPCWQNNYGAILGYLNGIYDTILPIYDTNQRHLRCNSLYLRYNSARFSIRFSPISMQFGVCRGCSKRTMTDRQRHNWIGTGGRISAESVDGLPRNTQAE